jgi:hypothetical protein
MIPELIGHSKKIGCGKLFPELYPQRVLTEVN